MKKILYIEEPLDPPGGGQISLFTILKNIDKNKYQFKVFINRPGVFKEMLEKNKIEVELVKPFLVYNKIKEYNPQIVHINSACTKYSFFCSFFSKILGKKVVWHNRVIESDKLKERIISFFVDRIIVVSDAVKKKFYYAHKKVVKLYNPIDLNNIKPQTSQTEIKRKVGLKSDAKIIGVFSRVEKWKGHKLLIRAFSKLNCENVFLLVCGEGKEIDNIRKLVEELKLDKKVIFSGYVENVYDYINICDIVVNPSLEPESFGRVIIESMSLAKPVVACALGGPQEIIENNVDGILVSPSETEIKNSIEKLLYDKDFYFRISKNAKNKAKKFDVNEYMVKLYSIYEQLL